jgi:hypothetical protein
VDEEVSRRAEAPYTLDYQRPDPAKPRGFARLTICFAAGVLFVLLIKVRQELSGNAIEGPDACGCMVMSPLYFWAALLIFTGSCRTRRAQMMVVRPAGEVWALVCGMVCLAPLLLPNGWLPEWSAFIWLAHALAFPALGTFFIFTPKPAPPDDSAPS